LSKRQHIQTEITVAESGKTADGVKNSKNVEPENLDLEIILECLSPHLFDVLKRLLHETGSIENIT
jgi:hypothetical protein